MQQFQKGDLVFHNWKIKKILGQGSFGVVYEIEREEFGKKYAAAAKIITIPKNKDDYMDALDEEMSEANVTEYYRSIIEDIVGECDLMERMKGDSHIVSYEDHQVEQEENGLRWTIYIRMELLTPLVNYIKTNPLSKRDVIQLGVDICRGLETCEKFHVIHRDIKPENIFVSYTHNYKLGDFGISKVLGKSEMAVSKKGTQMYMAPEVYRGEQYDATVDIYSLGLVLYRLFNDNRYPFFPPVPEAVRYQDKEQALQKRLSGQQLPYPSKVDGALGDIILKACAYDPKERYQTPEEFRKALEEFLEEVEGEESLEYEDTNGPQEGTMNIHSVAPGGLNASIKESENGEIVDVGKTLSIKNGSFKSLKTNPSDWEQAAKEREEEELRQQEQERIEKERRLQQEEEERQKILAEIEKNKEAERIKQEEEARKKAEAERIKQEEEARKKAEAERIKQEEEARKKAEAERIKQEEEARKKAEAERIRREEEARKKAAEIKRLEEIAKEKEDKVKQYEKIEEKLKENTTPLSRMELAKAEANESMKAKTSKGIDRKVVVFIGIIVGVIVIIGGIFFFGTTTVPNLQGEHISDAEELLSKKHLKLGKTKEVISNEIPAYVVSQDVKSGKRVWINKKVNLEISSMESEMTPDLLGMTQEEAEEKISKYTEVYDTELEVYGEAYSTTYEAGQIMSQEPEPGDPIDEFINVYISLGATTMPNLVGQNYNDAVNTLINSSVESIRKNEVISSNVPAGCVVAQDVEEGTAIGKETTVTLDVSQGAETFEVPNVVGKSEKEAQKALRAAGYSKKQIKVKRVKNDAKKGQVIEQNVAAGTQVEAGANITITVSKGISKQPEVQQSTPQQQAPRQSTQSKTKKNNSDNWGWEIVD